jgi:outer membrane scaffolding protein for murein synthesis (MipA/OmpV family)
VRSADANAIPADRNTNHFERHALNPSNLFSSESRSPGPAASRALLAGLALAGAAGLAMAQEPARNLLGLGAISLADFEGSADQAVRPFVLGRLSLGRYGSLRLAGLGAQWNVMGPKSPWAFGPVLSMRPARDDGVEDAVVRRLRKVDATGEAGGFVEYGFGDTLTKGDRLSVGLEARGGKGTQITWGLQYQAARTGAFQYGVDLRATYADDRYMDTYFSVDADNSLRSGLPVYKASGGLKSTSIGLTASVDLARQWTLVVRLGVSRLAGDASDSPIVRLRGDATSTAFGLALGYRF